MSSLPTGAPQPRIDKKRTVILLRSVVVISTSYLILFARHEVSLASIAYVLALLVTNFALTLVPAEAFHRSRFSAALLLGDTAMVLVGLYQTVGLSQDFLIVYFFTIFLTTAVEGVPQIALGATLVSGLYGYWLWTTAVDGMTSAEWLRLPFFYIIAIFYTYMTEEAKKERHLRLQAERQVEQLQLLRHLGEAVWQRTPSIELVRTMGGLIEHAFPRLTCDVSLEGEKPGASPGVAFAIASQGRSYGNLVVRPQDGSPLHKGEEQCCHLVALIAGNALYATEQMGVVREGTRVKEEFLGMVSHELRTPLHAILGYLEMLEGILGTSAGQPAQETMERLRANACRLEGLVEELLCFAELRAGNRSVRGERVDLVELFDQLAAGMRTQLAGRPIRFAWNVDADVPHLQVDRRKLRQLVNGLLSNAAKFTEHGFIRLSARASSQQLEIIVQDSGVGIDPQDVFLIFEEFRQLDSSMTRRFGGLGLGLALVRELASILGGRVAVESQANRGATFRLCLPLTGTSAPPLASDALLSPRSLQPAPAFNRS